MVGYLDLLQDFSLGVGFDKCPGEAPEKIAVSIAAYPLLMARILPLALYGGR